MTQTLLSKLAIDCFLSQGVDGLQGDGCIYALSSSSPPSLTTPEHLHPGDYVKLRLWLPDDGSSLHIDLAEVQWVKNHWIKLDLLITSPKDQARLRQFVAPAGHTAPTSRRMWEQILIRA